ncbi:hypothetical protein [Marinobacter nauticus]|jgi:hypothetical protein|uniref:hypothetical protein n=1 Tax=Marinobacter nauticus TaxID=2743 RepID=UPI001C996AF1|nr:hypothetical protein [Marinobacter nauticus]MBY5936405.1 hypothetical protein [Marinobacter nauticus]MBY5953634.1 hypothetical protein [Marinobacter nauticus]MBY6007427.1 hypothetical protein [Marinobacter nauticus]
MKFRKIGHPPDGLCEISHRAVSFAVNLNSLFSGYFCGQFIAQKSGRYQMVQWVLDVAHQFGAAGWPKHRIEA